MTEPVAQAGTSDRLTSRADAILVARILALVRDSVGVEIEDPTADLLASGIIDSLAFVSLLLAIEEAFSISIDIEELELADFQSVAHIARFIALQTTPGQT